MSKHQKKNKSRNFLPLQPQNNIAPLFFSRFRDGYLLTNQLRDYIFLSVREFQDFLDNKIDHHTNKDLYNILIKKSFIINSSEETFISESASKLRKLSAPLFIGTTLHIFVVTLQCTQKCIYCQAAQDPKKPTYMQSSTVNAAVDIVMQSPAMHLTIEFQGGEPLLNFPIICKIIERVEILAPKFDKKISFVLINNFTAMTDEKFSYLLQHNVSICTSLDGPKALHDKNRPYLKSSFDEVLFWTKKINHIYKEKNIQKKLNALPTITKHSLKYPDEIIDTYIKLGFDSLSVRYLSPFGRAQQDWLTIGYSAEEFIQFYQKILARIIELNLDGVSFQESFATMLVQKAIAKKPINFMELRSPCGAAIGQIAYDWNGDIYTCDEGRMLGIVKDYSFRIGNVFENTYTDCVNSNTSSMMVTASCIESHPDCSDCVYSPFCGICPIYNYTQHKSLFGYMSSDYRCNILKGMFTSVFNLLTSKEEHVRNIVSSWASAQVNESQ